MKINLLICFILLSISLHAQTPKAVYLEVGGPGLFSLNYDMRFSKKQNGWGGRVGLGRAEVDKIGGMVIPAEVNYLFGKQRNFLEVGAGLTYIAGTFDNNKNGYHDVDSLHNKFYGHLSVGYRYQSRDGFMFRAAFTPLIYKQIIPWAGLSIGYQFHKQKNVSPKPEGNSAKSVYLEAFGPGGLFSLNYDTRFARQEGGWGGRIGVGMIPNMWNKAPQFYIPVAVNYLLGKQKNFLELGGGISYITRATVIGGFDSTSNVKEKLFYPGVFSHLNIGYRLQPAKGGFMFRASFTPVFTHGLIIPWGGLSVGYKFKGRKNK